MCRMNVEAKGIVEEMVLDGRLEHALMNYESVRWLA